MQKINGAAKKEKRGRISAAARVDGENREMEAPPDREFIFAGLQNHGQFHDLGQDPFVRNAARRPTVVASAFHPGVLVRARMCFCAK